MEHSANLQLSYIMPSQAEKHVAHNEAIRALDALVQFAVLDRIFPRLPGRQKTEPAISFRLAEAMHGPARTVPVRAGRHPPGPISRTGRD